MSIYQNVYIDKLTKFEDELYGSQKKIISCLQNISSQNKLFWPLIEPRNVFKKISIFEIFSRKQQVLRLLCMEKSEEIAFVTIFAQKYTVLDIFS